MELEWWSCDSNSDTLRDGAGELAVPAGLHDHAGLFDPKNRTIHQLLIGIAFVILILAQCPLKGPAAERISRTSAVAGPAAAIARVEVDRTGWLELSFDEDPSKTDSRSKLWSYQ